MPKTRFGMGQLERPAPLWYRRFSNAYIVGLVPAIAALVEGWGIKDPIIVKRILLVLIFSGAFVKFVGMFLGNSQFYAPSNDYIEKMQEKEKEEKRQQKEGGGEKVQEGKTDIP